MALAEQLWTLSRYPLATLRFAPRRYLKIWIRCAIPHGTLHKSFMHMRCAVQIIPTEKVTLSNSIICLFHLFRWALWHETTKVLLPDNEGLSHVTFYYRSYEFQGAPPNMMIWDANKPCLLPIAGRPRAMYRVWVNQSACSVPCGLVYHFTIFHPFTWMAIDTGSYILRWDNLDAQLVDAGGPSSQDHSLYPVPSHQIVTVRQRNLK